MYIIQDYQRVNEFINKVFNYYNGKINICNYPAILKINWANLYTNDNAGSTIESNVVKINPMVISRHTHSQFEFYYNILETIIHELYHIDQIIDYYRIQYDNNYVNYIECAVETQTVIYIANHTNEIAEHFGLLINAEYFRDIIDKYDNGYSYHRKYYVDHIISMINTSVCKCILPHRLNSLCSKVRKNIETLIGTISVNINNNSIIIQDGSYLAPIQIVNEFFYNNQFKYTHNINITGNYTIYDNDIIIDIHFTPYNNMVKIVNK